VPRVGSLIDWLLVAFVVAGVLAIMWAIWRFIDVLIDYWKDYRDY
jgi:hypothetical protein